jgi:8-oxo-dGTP pyrophosphatase MutT (NUDIX family)
VTDQSMPIRDAATVVLLRDGQDGLETWMLTRVREMAFAGGMSVFPGGRVDEADADLPFVAGTLDGLADRFGCDESLARALVGAAVRETFEETGVLLTVPRADLADARDDVEAGRIAFGDLLLEHDLHIDASGVRAWSRWVTPPGETRRYDTRFFVAALPDGAHAQDVTSESLHASWVSVADALADARGGRRRLLPPTIMTLGSLESFTSVADVLAAAPERSLTAIRPEITVDQEAGTITAALPDGTSVVMPMSMFR